MGHLWLQVLPVGEADQRAALQESLMREHLEKYPEDFGANYSLGDVLLSKGDAAGAIPYFEAAAKADPSSALAASEFGVALFTASKIPEAIVQFRRALAIDKNYTDARFNLASAEAASADWEHAAADFEQVLAERPDHAKAREHLGEVQLLWGKQFEQAHDDERAAGHYREALRYRASDVELHVRLGLTYARLEKLNESQTEFETVLKLEPNHPFAKQAIDAIVARRKATGK
jgi:tetratricopeptide (TPR) repeat protein